MPEATEAPSVLESLLDLLMGATTGGMLPGEHTKAEDIGGLMSPLAGMAVRRLGKAGSAIPRGQQSGLSPEMKIPRFRSENGTFVKHQGQWWRLKPFKAEDKEVTLEFMGSGEDFTGDVLKSKTVPMETMISKAQAGNAANTQAKKVARRRK